MHPAVSATAFSLPAALLPLLSAWGWGCLLWRGRAPSLVWAIVAGTPIVSLGIFALLLAGLLTPPLAAAWCALGLAGAFRRGPHAASLPAPPLWVWLFAAAYGVLYLIHALAPEIEPDAAGYHLGLVAEWLRTGAFAPRIGFYEMLPLGVETLFAPAVALGGYPAAKLLHLAFLLLTGPLAAHLAARLALPPAAAWAGWLLYAITPATGVAASAAYSDAAAVFFSLATATALLEWRATRELPWALAAGLAGGFCYAVKLPGLLFVAAAVLFLAAHRAWIPALAASAAALVSVAPWMGRALWLTGNPLAPLGNSLFPNPHFHQWTEQSLSAFLKDYGVASWTAIPHALLLDGAALQGLLGPIWTLSPLALLALRKPAGRWLMGAALLAALPWFANAGARFLLPSLLFTGIALASAGPRFLAPSLVALHALLSWPGIVPLYANPLAWRLSELPWAAVTGQESPETYLGRRLHDYPVARMVRRHVPPGDGLLDLYALPTAYSGIVGAGSLPSVPFDQMADTLARAAAPLPESLDLLRCRFPGRFLRAVRWRLAAPFPAPWSIREVRFLHQGHARPVLRSWFLDARPSPQDAPLACDRNPATAWHTWSAAPAGSHYEVRFGRPQPLDTVEAVMPHLRGGRLRPLVEGQTMDNQWVPLHEAIEIEPLSARPLRREAVTLVRHRGLRWIVVPYRDEGHGFIGRAMSMAPQAWGVEEVARTEGARLFRLLP